MSSPPTPDELARAGKVLEAAGIDPHAAQTAVRGGGNVLRLDAAGRRLACKLFLGPSALERLDTEAALYAQLHPRGAPVPRLVKQEPGALALLREWAPGEPLDAALRAGRAGHMAESVLAAWRRLLATLAPWTEALASARLERAQSLRLSELEAVSRTIAEASVSVRPFLIPPSARSHLCGLPELIARTRVCTVPLDLAPSNVILNARGAIFVDLEIVGLDFPAMSLCKTLMLGCGPAAGRTPASLLDGAWPEADGVERSALEAAYTLVALADAAGVWRRDRAPCAEALDLVRRAPGYSEVTRGIRDALK